MHTRDFSTAQCVVYALRPDKTKVPVDWNTLSSYLAGSEVSQITHIYACNIECFSSAYILMKSTVEPPYYGHHWDPTKRPLLEVSFVRVVSQATPPISGTHQDLHH